MVYSKFFLMAAALLAAQMRLIRLRRLLLCLPLALGLLPCTALAQFADTFDTLDPAWATDRYAPAAFQVVSFLGDNRLQITIDQSAAPLIGQ